MPTYSFRNIHTGEQWDEFLSYAERCDLLENNKDIEPVITAPAVISGISGLTHKTDSGFKDMLSRVAAANPMSPLAAAHGDKGIRASKTRAAVNREKERQLKR